MNTLKIIGTFDSANVRSDNVVTLKFKFPYSEISNFIQLVTTTGREIPCKITPDDHDEAIKLGRVILDRLAIDKDGEAKVTFKGDLESIDLGELHVLSNQTLEVAFRI